MFLGAMSEGAALVLQDVRRETRAAVMSMSFIDSPGEEGDTMKRKRKDGLINRQSTAERFCIERQSSAALDF